MAQDTETYGRFIALLHDDGYSSWYAHLSKTLVHKLDNVKAGQVIGLTGGAVGSDGAGQSTGWHLHFEVRTPGNLDNNKKNVDPMKYIESLVTK
jgi:murein DD-endopeptidase MepM/ murein hydrolase activator NlpD